MQSALINIRTSLIHGIRINLQRITTCRVCQQKRFSDLKYQGRIHSHNVRKFNQLKKYYSHSFIATFRPLSSSSGNPPVKDPGKSNQVNPSKKSGATEFSAPNIPDNKYVDLSRAMHEYLLSSSDLKDLQAFQKRSPFPEKDKITVYLRRSVEKKCIRVWGSLENMQKEKQRRQNYASVTRGIFRKNLWTEYDRLAYVDSPSLIVRGSQPKKKVEKETLLKSASGRVILSAIAVNTINFLIKLAAWIHTGSYSMFAEFLHSVADTMNQIVLAVGLHQSFKEADLEHPYGWTLLRNVTSLSSGIAIFFIGGVLSCFHGIYGFFYPQPSHSLMLGIAVLGVSFITDFVTLVYAITKLNKSAKQQNMSFKEYFSRTLDPSVNVVLLEDAAAVFGVVVAAICMVASDFYGSLVPDLVGAVIIGNLLGAVAYQIVKTNSRTLMGRSIPPEKKFTITRELENDQLVRALHDVKATDIGSAQVRFKAEVDFDGKELTRIYLQKQNMAAMLKDMKSIQTEKDVEDFMLMHGEQIVDTLGGEVDRIEKSLKKKFPEIRHVDLEQL